MTTTLTDNDSDETTATSTPALSVGNRHVLKVFRAALIASVVANSMGSQAAIAQSGVSQYVGGFNYVLSNNCEPIKDLKVTIHATQDIVGPKGLGFQLNATAPAPTESDKENPYGPTAAWQQYMIGFGPQPGINYAIDIFHLVQQPNANLLVNIPSTVFDPNVGSNKLPAGYTLTITLQNSGDDVVGAIFTAQDGDNGKVFPAYWQPMKLPAGAHRIVTAFQMNLVGPTGGDVLSQGAGWIEYTASTPLTVRNPNTAPNNGYPVDSHNHDQSCVATTTLTGENSNMTYDPVLQGSGKTLVQSFFVPPMTSGGPISNPPACVAPMKWNYQQQRCSTSGTDAYDRASPQTVGQPVETQPH